MRSNRGSTAAADETGWPVEEAVATARANGPASNPSCRVRRSVTCRKVRIDDSTTDRVAEGDSTLRSGESASLRQDRQWMSMRGAQTGAARRSRIVCTLSVSGR
jgi:hypothetical protein